MHQRDQQKDNSPLWWGAVFAAAAIFLGLMVYTTGPDSRTANHTESSAPTQLR